MINRALARKTSRERTNQSSTGQTVHTVQSTGRSRRFRTYTRVYLCITLTRLTLLPVSPANWNYTGIGNVRLLSRERVTGGR